MIPMQEIHDLAKSGSDSVFEYVERTAEEVSDGIRWQTLDYGNEPHHHFDIFNGVAGICLFLADYFQLTGIERARNLALGGARWCSLPEHEGYTRGLYVGRTGVGMAWLHLSRVTEDPELLTHCGINAEKILREDPGPVTDILGGASGNGLFLLRLWEATQDERYLEGAVRNGEWIRGKALRDKSGCYWPMEIGDSTPWYSLGFAHGISGGAYFLLLLYEMTKEACWVEFAQEVLETLSRQAKSDRGGLNWPVTLNGEKLERCQWCHGAPGIGLLYAKAYEVLDEPSYLETAQAAGETTFAYGDVRNNPSQCHGLAGNAELFIELYRVTQNQLWIERAYDFANRAFEYRKKDVDGDTWQADEPGYYSQDFMCGASGTGHFFLRLWAPDELRMPLA